MADENFMKNSDNSYEPSEAQKMIDRFNSHYAPNEAQKMVDRANSHYEPSEAQKMVDDGDFKIKESEMEALKRVINQMEEETIQETKGKIR